MSVYGGDSWGREAQYRKRRADDLIIEGIESSVYKKLPNGKFVCIVCPNNPIVDTPIMLSAHVSGSRHRAAESRRKDREIAIQQEISKRRATEASIEGRELAIQQEISNRRATEASIELRKTTGKPLIERARKAASEVFSGDFTRTEAKSRTVNLSKGYGGNGESFEMAANHKKVVGEAKSSLDYHEQRERELKFVAAGWKRDGHGRWFKDENVEFDSDEEDPNIVLNGST